MMLKETVPSISRVGVIWDATIGPYRLPKELGAAARSLGIEVVGFEVREPADFDRSVVNATTVPVGGLIITSTPLTGRYAKEMSQAVNAHRLPSIALFRSQAESGLLMTYGPSLRQEFRSAATYVDNIRKGRIPVNCQ
jgi:putative ABC transport system substrate-binding protein